MPGIKGLFLDFDNCTMPTEWQNGEIDDTVWHDLLRPFIGVRELSRALQMDDVSSDPDICEKSYAEPSIRSLHGSPSLLGYFVHDRWPLVAQSS